MDENKEVAIRKYSAIAKANKSMFISVSIASVVASSAAVLATFLVQKIIFKTKVIEFQNKTISSIRVSSGNIEGLKSKVKELQTNEDLLNSKADAEDNALRVILDSLPAEGNAEAIGSSLSSRIFNVGGLTVENLTVDPVDNTNDELSSSASSSSLDSSSSNSEISDRVRTVNFSFSVVARGGSNNGGDDSSRTPHAVLMELLKNMERSIRTFNISDFKVDMNKDGSMNLSVTGQAYYLPRYNLQLIKKVIKSSEGKSSSGAPTSIQGGNRS